jgi:hypothetical protein
VYKLNMLLPSQFFLLCVKLVKKTYNNEQREYSYQSITLTSNDILTSIWWQLCWQPCFSHFLLVKNSGERKRKRGDNNIMWVWERKLSKSCQKVVVKISFLYINLPVFLEIKWFDINIPLFLIISYFD